VDQNVCHSIGRPLINVRRKSIQEYFNEQGIKREAKIYCEVLYNLCSSDNKISTITYWVVRLAVHKVDMVRNFNEETVCLK
jgi:tRNA(Ile)-lysidine synthase TilS/MesJ